MLETSEKEVDQDEYGLKKDTCIRCDGRVSLLKCNVSDCPIAIHENCISCKPTFDDDGNFYCPYCSYKRASIQADKSEKKVMTAKRKDGMSEKVEDHPVQVEHNQHKEKNSKQTKSEIVSCDEGACQNSFGADDIDIDISEADTEATKKFSTKENSTEANVNDLDNHPDPHATDVRDSPESLKNFMSKESFSGSDIDGRIDESELPVNTNLGSQPKHAGGEAPLKQKMGVKTKACKIKKFPTRWSLRTLKKEIEKDPSNKIEDVSKSKMSKEDPKSFKKIKTPILSNAKCSGRLRKSKC